MSELRRYLATCENEPDPARLRSMGFDSVADLVEGGGWNRGLMENLLSLAEKESKTRDREAGLMIFNHSCPDETLRKTASSFCNDDVRAESAEKKIRKTMDEKNGS